MTAPLDFVSGAPVAQMACATGEIAPSINPAAHRRATAPCLWRGSGAASWIYTFRAIPRERRATLEEDHEK